MAISIKVYGYGSSAILIVGSILLALVHNSNWIWFLLTGIGLAIFFRFTR